MTHDPDQRTGPTPIAERVTYNDPTGQAAIREATSASPATAAGGLTERDNWITELTRRLETTNGGAGGRYISVGVAASVGVGFAADVADAVSSDPVIADLQERIIQVEGVNQSHATVNRGLMVENETLAARVKVLQEAGRMISEGAAKERNMLAEKIRAVTVERDAAQQGFAVLDERVTDLTEQLATRSDRIDPTPAQITTYLKAATAAAPEADDPYVVDPMASPGAVRAGLAAVQWALLNPTTTDSGTEVSAQDARTGDRITITGTVGTGDPDDTLTVELWGRNYYLTETDILFTRPDPPLPTEPGTVVEATINGRTVTLVLTDEPDPEYRWFTVAGHDPERRSRDRWVPAADITAVRVLSTPDSVAGDTL